MSMRRFMVLVVSCFFAASVPLSAAEASKSSKKEKTSKKTVSSKKEDAKEATADAETAALLDRSDSLLYSLAGEGVKRATCKGESSQQMTGQAGTKRTFQYIWDGAGANPKGKVTFLDGAAGPEPAGAGLSPRELLDSQFKNTPWKKEFAGCKLSSSKEGGKTAIRIEGTNSKGISGMILNAEGLPGEIEMDISGLGKATMKIQYAKVKDMEKYLPSKTALAMGGTAIMEMANEFAAADKYQVMTKTVMTQSMGPLKVEATMTFSDYRFNEAAGAEPEDKGEKGKAGAGKASAGKKKKT